MLSLNDTDVMRQPPSLTVILLVIFGACTLTSAAAAEQASSPEQLKETLQWIGLVGGAIGALATIYLKVIKPARKQMARGRVALQQLEDMARLHAEFDFGHVVADVSQIINELKPNSGCSMRDAVDRIEARLIQMEAVQGAMNQDHPLGILRADREGRVLQANRTFARWLGASKDEILGWGWRNFLCSSDDNDALQKARSAAYKDGREIGFQICYLDGDRNPVCYEGHSYPIADKTGEVVQYLSIYRPQEPSDGCSTDPSTCNSCGPTPAPDA